MSLQLWGKGEECPELGSHSSFDEDGFGRVMSLER